MTALSHRGDEGVGARMADAPNFLQRLGRDSAYVLTGFPLALPAFVLVVVLVSVGAGLSIILVGLPILVLGILTARGFAYLERQRLGRLTGETPGPPRVPHRPTRATGSCAG